ncbi:MAG: thioredoxin family protein [Sulfurospirillaceae bacterium]|nr:thioredoxin family protein [Sulfurospirillaceae bacterium]
MKKIILCVLLSISLWAFNFEEAVIEAKKEHKLLLVELEMESCPYCERMEKFVLSKDDVKKLMDEHYVFIKLDINKEVIPEHLTSRMTPTFYFLSSDGESIIEEIKGAPSKSDFINYLNKVKEGK